MSIIECHTEVPNLHSTMLKYKKIMVTFVALTCMSSIFGIIMYALLWGFLDTERCISGSTIIYWGGTGGASARTLTPVLLFSYFALVIACIVYYMVIRTSGLFDAKRYKQKIYGTAQQQYGALSHKMKQYEKAATAVRFVGLAACLLITFLSGFLIAVTGSPAARGMYNLYGCTNDPWKGFWWYTWGGAASLILVSAFGHAIIPESSMYGNKPITTGIAWTSGALRRGEIDKQVYVVANTQEYDSENEFRVREYRNKLAKTTVSLSVATIVVIFVCFGKSGEGIDIVANSTNTSLLMCNCVGATNISMCEVAKQLLYENVQSTTGGGTMWVTLSVGIVCATVFLMICIVNLIQNKKLSGVGWIVTKWTRYTVIFFYTGALITIGYACGGLWGSPMIELSMECCPTNDCRSIKNYAAGILICVASSLYAASLLLGHFIQKDNRHKAFGQLMPTVSHNK